MNETPLKRTGLLIQGGSEKVVSDCVFYGIDISFTETDVGGTGTGNNAFRDNIGYYGTGSGS